MLKEYIKENRRVDLRIDRDLKRDKFLFLNDELNQLKEKLEQGRTKNLGDIVNIRLGGFTGCDNGFIVSQEKGEYLLSLNKYKGLIIPCKRPKGFHDGVGKDEYLIHIQQGFTNSRIEQLGTLDKFKLEYSELFTHFDGLDESIKSSLLSRQEHFKGDYWWELSKGQCNYENYKNEGYLIPRISKRFELIEFDGSFIPLNGFSYVGGKLENEIEDYLRSDDFTTLFNHFYSTDVKQGGYYTRNVNVVKSIKI